MFITLTLIDSRPIEINLNRIEYFTDNNIDRVGSILYFSLQDSVKVKESVEEIYYKIRNERITNG